MDAPEPLMPREKMWLYGIETLSDDELLALFLRTGTGLAWRNMPS